jgi:hypothetical protein
MLPEWKGGRSYGRETLSEMRGCAGDAGFACGWNHSGEKKWELSAKLVSDTCRSPIPAYEGSNGHCVELHREMEAARA